MQVAVSYRERGQTDWLDARTVNISRTGLLMECPAGPSVGAPLDLLLRFDPPLAIVSCAVRVVRAAPSAVNGHWQVAASIFRYAFVSKPPAPE